MDELYSLMKQKLEEMYRNKTTHVTLDFDAFARLYQLVCYMKQIQTIANGLE